MRTSNLTVNRLANWISNQLLAHTVGEREKPVQAFSLMHVEGGINEKEVKTIKVGGPVEPVDLARAFFSAATDYASGIASGSGLQQFVVFAHVEGVDERPQLPIKVSGESEIGLVGTEPATKDGFFSQLMRHNEALVRAVVGMNERLMANAENVWQVQETAMHQRLETLQLTETVISQAAEGEHRKRLEVMAFQRATEERNRLLTIAPALGNMLLGTEVFPTSTVDSSILEAVAGDLSADDLESLLGVLRMKVRPEVATVLTDRFIKIIDAKKKAAQSQPSPDNGETKH